MYIWPLVIGCFLMGGLTIFADVMDAPMESFLTGAIILGAMGIAALKNR